MKTEQRACSICRDPIDPETTRIFADVPLCQQCHQTLDLEDVEDGEPDEIVLSLVDDKGKEVLGKVSSLVRKQPRDLGWKVMAMAPLVGEQVEDETRKVLIGSGLLLMGSTLARTGCEGSGDEMDDRLVTLLILLGQYVDLSVMGRINEEFDLKKDSFLHELVLKEEHDHRLFGLLKILDTEDDDEKKAVLVNSMNMLMP